MVELAGIPPFGGGGVNIRQTNTPPAPAVPAVEAAATGQGLSGRMSSNQSQSESGSDRHNAPSLALPGPDRPDPHALPGPPPAFQISLLELDRDLAQTLARLNAEHIHSSEAVDLPDTSQEAPIETDPPEPEIARSTGDPIRDTNSDKI